MAQFHAFTQRILLSIVVLGFSVCTMMAHVPITTQKPQKKTTQQDDQPNMDGVVEVSFKIDATGKIQIVDLVSTSPQLSEYVIKKLAKIQINEQSAESGKVIKYRFTFKKQT